MTDFYFFVCILGQLFDISADFLPDLFSQKMQKTNKDAYEYLHICTEYGKLIILICNIK